MTSDPAQKPLWFQLLDRFGVPTATLFLVLVGVGYCARWLATHAVEPLVTAHQEYLSSQTKLTEQLAADLDLIVREETEQTAILQRLESTLARP